MDEQGRGRASRRRRWLIALAVILGIPVVIDGILGLVVTAVVNNRMDKHCSHSIAEARWNGTLVTRLRPVPQEVEWRGQRVVIQDAWVEHRSERFYTIVIIPGFLHIPINTHTSGYYIGVQLKEGWDVFHTDPYALLFREGETHSFWEIGEVVLSEETDYYNGSPIKVHLTDNSDGTGGVTIMLERE
jgi:hypothetical protein